MDKANWRGQGGEMREKNLEWPHELLQQQTTYVTY